MIYYKTQFKGRDEVYCTSIRSTTDYINKIIKEDRISSFPVSNHIIATWTCNNKKSSKYDFVSVTKIIPKEVIVVPTYVLLKQSLLTS